MSAILLAVALAVGSLSAPLRAEAQEPGKTYLVGVLSGRPPDADSPPRAAFRQALRERGWVEGQNVVIELHWSEGKSERFFELAVDLVRRNVDVIVTTGGDPATLAARRATATIPIVALSVDPVGVGLASSLGRPGGNITGLSILAAELGGKRLELLREAVPRVSRVAVLWNAAFPGKQLELLDTRTAARALGVTIQSVEVRGPGDFDAAFSTISKSKPDALITFSEPLTLTHRRRIVDFAARHRLPLISEIREFADDGGLMTYGPDLVDLVRRAGYYVDRILRGARPATLPFEQPTKFQLVINLKTARALGLTVPATLRLRADELIE